jgi:hypothetical protein
VDPVPNPLLLRNSCSAGNRTGASGLAARTLITRPQRRSNPNKNDEYRFLCINIAIQFRITGLPTPSTVNRTRLGRRNNLLLQAKKHEEAYSIGCQQELASIVSRSSSVPIQFFLLKSRVTQNFLTIKTSWNTND